MDRPSPSDPPPSRDAAGRIRLVRFAAGAVDELEGDAALSELAAATARATDATAEGAALGAVPAKGAAATRTLWVDLTDPEPATVERVATLLGLHPLIAEDVVEGNQRSKLEVTDGLAHLVVFALEAAELDLDGDGSRGGDGRGGHRVVAHEVDLVLGDGFLLSAHQEAWEPRRTHHFRGGPASVMKAGPDHLLWAMVDGIVDGYFPFADRLEELIDRLQDDVVDRPTRETLQRLFGLKRDLIAVRRAVSPVREILNQLTNRELAIIDAEEVLYFRDVYDHVIRLADELDTDRELVAATVEIYLSTINNNLSTIMKRLTGVTVILAGIGAIAGIFGMSEAGQAFAGAEASGFWVVTLVVVGIAVGLALVLRRIDWI